METAGKLMVFVTQYEVVAEITPHTSTWRQSMSGDTCWDASCVETASAWYADTATGHIVLVI